MPDPSPLGPRFGGGSLQEAILGLLAIRPMSGYDVRRSYQRALQSIWYAPIGQVYPTLRKMAQEGLVEPHVEVQEGRPNRKVYSLTPQGREKLTGWLSRPADLPEMHHGFIHRLFLLDHLAPERREDFARDYAGRCRVWAEELQTIHEKMQPALRGRFHETARYQLLSLEHLIRLVECEATSAEMIARQITADGPLCGCQEQEQGVQAVLADFRLVPTAEST